MNRRKRYKTEIGSRKLASFKRKSKPNNSYIQIKHFLLSPNQRQSKQAPEQRMNCKRQIGSHFSERKAYVRTRLAQISETSARPAISNSEIRFFRDRLGRARKRIRTGEATRRRHLMGALMGARAQRDPRMGVPWNGRHLEGTIHEFPQRRLITVSAFVLREPFRSRGGKKAG